MAVIITEETKGLLETLAGVKEEDYTITERGIKFNFNNSLQANYCQIIEYHDNYLVEFRKIASNLIEGNYNRLVSEKVILKEDFQSHFENTTGIYLSFLG